MTWPQNVATKEATLQSVKDKWEGQVVWCVVAEEQHKTGEPHLHAVVKFARKMHISGTKGMKLLDSITGKHGNYQAVKSLKNTVSYVVKEGTYVSDGINVPLFIAAAVEKKSTVMATMVLEDKSMEDICKEDPGFFMMHKRRLEDLQVWHERKKAKLMLAEWVPLELTEFDVDSDLLIADWLNSNIGVDRKFKAKQLYIQGPPDMGKTTLIQNLSKFCRVYYVPTEEDFCCHYEDSDWDLAIIDEFKGQKMISWLNKWLDGQVMPLKRKGISSILKRKNIPTIILSNYCLEVCYAKAMEETPGRLEPLLARLEIVDVITPINVLYTSNE